MDFDLLISLVIFISCVSVAVVFFTNYFSQIPILKSLGELRDVAMEIKNKLFSSEGIMIEIYRMQVLVEEDAGLERENEPIEMTLLLDEDCINKSLNNSIRVQDENWKEVPFRFENQEFCDGNYLKSAKITFNVNISAYEKKVFQIFYHNRNVNVPSYKVILNTSSWIPNDGDSWTENTNNWFAYDTINLDQDKKVGNYSLNTTGNFENGKIELTYNPADNISGIENGWYLRAWLFVDNKTDLRTFISISDGTENISYEITNEIKNNEWYLFEKEISNEWQNWQNFDASRGIDFVSYYATNQTPTLIRTLKIDGLRFEKKPLIIKVFPEEKIEVISMEKLKELRNKSVEEIIGIIGTDYEIRIEIMKPE